MNPSTVTLLMEYGVRSTLLLAIAFCAAQLLRQRSSAWLHVVWFAGLMSLLVLPAAEAWTPKWASEVPLLFSAQLRTVINVVADAGAPHLARKPVDWLLAVWLAGTALVLIRFALSAAMASRLARNAEPWLDGARISAETTVPLVCGLWNPVIVLPREAAYWMESRRQSVMRHEQMHITRWDTGSQALAQLACAFYWPQPLVWLAAAQLRKECEHACDDGVLVAGTKPSVYAEDLMEIARGLKESMPVPARFAIGGIAMTRTHHLEDRISALLNPRKDRRGAGAGFAASVTGLALTLVVSLAALRTPLLAQQGKLTGVVRDVSGAAVSRARIDLTSHDPKVKYHEIAYTNDAGEFSFDNVPDSGYDVSAAKAGFARLEQKGIRYESAKSGRLDMTLSLGIIQENVQVIGAFETDLMKQKLEAELKAKSINVNGEPARLQIGGHVQAAKLEYKVTPPYPPGAKADRVQGTVLMAAVIGVDGSVMSLTQVNKQIDQRLVDVAMDAVKQWRYQPTLLNGNPVEIVTQIEVNFTLSR